MFSKTALAAGLVGAAALGLAGTGSFAAFSTSASVTQNISTGTLEVTLANQDSPYNAANATGTSGGTLPLAQVSNLAPGQTFYDAVKITNTGSVNAELTQVSYDAGATSANGALLAALSATARVVSYSGLSGTLPPTGTISLGSPNPTPLDIVLAPGGTITVGIAVTFSANAGNDAQGETATPSLTVAVQSTP